ncbi:SDR family NAD(P)-dependent oxidoreductase [Nocardioides alkalitolerans]|uniref:SDR family NAD(P)-dependent oxidoreductase n=1 Tax=Nocardioides alkalitolerans TaxID=281714 RepID=UPI000412C0E3|nr:SDR family NAD(P)-dependent oxidoreductase [Nocardioides alkalitolerans]
MSTPRPAPLALITGASSGIGLEMARDLYQRGYDLLIVGSSERIDEAAAELRGPDPTTERTIIPVRADLTTYDGVEDVWTAFTDLDRPLDAALLNAGMGIGGAFVDTDLDDELKMIALNCTSQVHLAKRVIPLLVTQGHGRVLFTSSVSATTATPYEPVYGPTRSFVFSFANGLREELRGTGVSVTTLLPGATDSGFHGKAGMGDTKFGDNTWKNDRRDVARQGVEAMLKGRPHVIGGNRATKRTGLLNKFLPETYKARRQGKQARPSH